MITRKKRVKKPADPWQQMTLAVRILQLAYDVIRFHLGL